MLETQSTATYPASGIHILVVGGGIAGLTTALEAVRNGHRVTVLESQPTNDPHGDFFALGPSGTEFLKYWPRLKKQFDEAAFDAVALYSKHTGILGFTLPRSAVMPYS